jgi:hypothetical protein
MARLLRMGFEVRDGELLTSLSAAREAVVSRSLKPYLMLSDSARKDFEGLEPAELSQANSVVVGLAPEAFTYDKLNTAFRLRESSPPPPRSASRQPLPKHADLDLRFDVPQSRESGSRPHLQRRPAARGI